MEKGKEVASLELVSRSASETADIGERIGQSIEGHFTVALTGELGSGKTVLAQGICSGLGVDQYVTSPSFIIINEYSGRLPVRHVDLYRVNSPEELESTGFFDLFSGDCVVLIEWADKLEHPLPEPVLDVEIEYLDPNGRRLVFSPRGEEAVAVLERLGRRG